MIRLAFVFVFLTSTHLPDTAIASGVPIGELRPVPRPGHIGLRPGPLMPDMISVFNLNFDRETARLSADGAEQRAFCSDPAPVRPGEPASVMLVSVYENGWFRQGSGTVIRGSGLDGSPDRVVTASHVVTPFMPDDTGTSYPISRVIAFGADGERLADLDPIIAGDIAHLDLMNDADMVFDDVAVLEPVRFADERAREAWASMGVPVATSQPERLLALFQPPGSVALNPGMSGAGVFDDEGRLIGVFSYTLFLRGDPYLDRPETGYETRFSGLHGEGATASLTSGLIRLNQEQGLRLRRDNVGYALPLRHREIRAALNVTEPPSPAAPDGYATVFGYPRLTCLSVDVRRIGTQLPVASERLRGLANYETESPLADASAAIKISEMTHD